MEKRERTYREISSPVHTLYLIETKVITPYVCKVNWPCKCKHRHGRWGAKHKDIQGKLKGMCPKCECRWYDPMSNFEYIKWKR